MWVKWTGYMWPRNTIGEKNVKNSEVKETQDRCWEQWLTDVLLLCINCLVRLDQYQKFQWIRVLQIVPQVSRMPYWKNGQCFDCHLIILSMMLLETQPQDFCCIFINWLTAQLGEGIWTTTLKLLLCVIHWLVIILRVMALSSNTFVLSSGQKPNDSGSIKSLIFRKVFALGIIEHHLTDNPRIQLW